MLNDLANRKNIKVWYHGNCDDGFGAAWAAYRFFKSLGIEHRVNYEAVHYGKPPPEFSKEDIIYIVDFSFDRNTIEKIKENCSSLQVLDHHKTAEEALQGLPYALFDMSRSGAMITWDFFNDKVKAPKLIEYIQANDLWKHYTMPCCQAIIRYLRSVPQTFESWDILYSEFETKLAEVILQAKAIERYFQQQVQFQIQHARCLFITSPDDSEIELECPVINTTVTFISELCHALHQHYKTEIAMSYLIKSDNTAMISLRSAGKVDVSKIAKKHGGGGHHNAAGFIIPAQNLIAFLEGKLAL